MASSRDIRRRIKSVKSTAQITKAMQMVAASKMRKAQQAALAGRPYTTTMNRMLAELLPATGDFSHPLMERRPGGSRCVILVSTDKGLCGALNSTLFRKALRQGHHGLISRAQGRAVFARPPFVAGGISQGCPAFSEPAPSPSLSRKALKGEYHRDAFTNFVSTLTQRPGSHQPATPARNQRRPRAGR